MKGSPDACFVKRSVHVLLVCYIDSTGHPNIQTKIIYNWLNTSIMFKQTRTDYFHVLHKLRTDIAYLVGTSGFCQMHFFKEGI